MELSIDQYSDTVVDRYKMARMEQFQYQSGSTVLCIWILSGRE